MSRRCSYCGVKKAGDQEHVFPKGLYPASKRDSKVQRLAVPACRLCNGGWSNDEVQFRNVIILAGEPNEAVHELWSTTINRSFSQSDGLKRVAELAAMLRPVQAPPGQRSMIFPAEDERVMRVVKKIIRGLSHYHSVATAVSETRVWADVQRHAIPPEFLKRMSYHHREVSPR